MSDIPIRLSYTVYQDEGKLTVCYGSENGVQQPSFNTAKELTDHIRKDIETAFKLGLPERIGGIMTKWMTESWERKSTIEPPKSDPDGPLSFDDSYDDNKRKFVTRLVTEAGWTKADAEAEYENAQGEAEGEL